MKSVNAFAIKKIAPALASVLFTLPALLTSAQASAQTDNANEKKTQALYEQHCQSCHGVNRLGGLGPALLPENLSRLRQNKAVDVIANGRAATQMPAFSAQLDNTKIQSLVDYIYQPPKVTPDWTLDDALATRWFTDPLPNKPLFDADLMNLFIVVETGDHHATLLNGDTFEPIHRFKTRYALHGGPKYSPDGRYVYFGSRDGWISKFDIYNLKTVAEIRAGINMRNIAVSKDGKWVMAANYLPHTLVLFNAEDLTPVKQFDVKVASGEGSDIKSTDITSSRVSAVYTAPQRDSFIAALKDAKEVWEIPYANAKNAADFTVRHIQSEDYLDDFFFDPDYKYLIGATRGGQQAQVIDLDSGKTIASLPLAGMPHLGSGIDWMYEGKAVFATPHLKTGAVSVIEMGSWKHLKTIQTDGPGFFMRSHVNTPYAWVDVFFGPNKDRMHVFDKNTLEIKKTLIPAPGKTAAHVEFTKDGRYALVSLWEDDGALIIYDASTLEEVKRLPMSKPSGKYNVFNKINYAQGTSH